MTLSSDPALFPDMGKQIADGTPRMRGNRSIEERDRERGTMLIELLAIRSKGEKAATAGGRCKQNAAFRNQPGDLVSNEALRYTCYFRMSRVELDGQANLAQRG